MRSLAKFRVVGLGPGVGVWAVVARRRRSHRGSIVALADLLSFNVFLVHRGAREAILRSLAKFWLVGLGLGVGAWAMMGRRRHRHSIAVLASLLTIFWFSARLAKAFWDRWPHSGQWVLGLVFGPCDSMARRRRRRRRSTAALVDLSIICWFSVGLAKAF